MLIKPLFILFCCVFVKSNDDKNCFDNKIEKIDLHLATKTPYRVISNKNDKEIAYRGKLIKYLFIFLNKKILTSLFEIFRKKVAVQLKFGL